MVLSEWTDGRPEEKKACLDGVQELQRTFLTILTDIPDTTDQESCFALMYILVRSQWILLNSQINYQNANGQLNTTIFHYGALLSGLLGSMESALPPNRVAYITRYLLNAAEPFQVELDNTDEAMLRAKLRELNETLTTREHEITRSHNEWEILEAGTGKRTVREVVELVRELKDDLLTIQRNGGNVVPERFLDFDREFGGLSARQVALQIERLENQVKGFQREASQWTQAQEKLVRELGEANPDRLIERMHELQQSVTNLSLELSRAKRAESAVPTHSETPSNDITDLDAMLGNLEDVLRQINA